MRISRDIPLITVIVGIYNGAKYLRECLDSIIRQTYSNLEILLVDDGSKDSSGEIAEEYAVKDDRICVVHQKNAGVSAARNIALDRATGDYICVMDQDDILSREYIEYFYKLIAENDAEIAYTPTADKFWGIPHSDRADLFKAQVIEGDEAVIRMLYHKIVIAPWNKMISRVLIEKNHIRFNPDYFGGEGFAFSVECFQCAKRVVVGDKKVYHYRVGDPESGASKFRLSMIHSSVNAQKYIRNILYRPTDQMVKAWEFSNWHTHCDCLNVMVGCHVIQNYPDEYKKLKKVCQSQALCSLKAPISVQQKLRGVLFKVNPYFAACIINKFRKRKFLGGVTMT